ncbi:MAG TPA: hypothetical protein VGW35_25815, partial [Methylomirabilota bacterium]|nr:hypothetical protein [Methylomirabilota bacterium]
VLKVSEASIGPAAVWEPFRRLFALLRFPDELARDMYYAALANWLAFAALLVSQMRFLERRGLPAGSIALAIGVTYFGTPLVYYGLFSVASEMLAALSVWLVFRRLASGEPETPTAWLALGALCGLAVLVRTNTAVFVAIMLLPLAVSRLCRRPWPVWTLHLALLAAGALAGMLPALILNTVFLGAPLRTLYSVRLASGEFLMLDFAHPKLTEVLLSHWHGLLVYSPIYLLAAGGAALALARDLGGRRDQPPGTRRRWHRPFDDPLPYLVGVYAVTYLYLASAWRPWWMGTGTLGGRQFITLAPFATLSVASLLRRVEGTRWCLPVTASSLLCGIWTLLLALQRDTNFTVSYAQLWEAQLTTVTHHLGLDILPLAAASLTVLFAHAVWHRTGAPSAAALCLVAALVWGTTLLLALVAGYLPLIRPPGTGAFLAVSLALALGVAVLCRMSFHPAPASWLLRPLAVTGFLAITAIPVWTGASTLVRLQRGETPVRRDFRTAHLLALTDGLQEYGRIAGYERDRAAWHRLVDEFARTTAALPPDAAGAPARPRP